MNDASCVKILILNVTYSVHVYKRKVQADQRVKTDMLEVICHLSGFKLYLPGLWIVIEVNFVLPVKSQVNFLFFFQLNRKESYPLKVLQDQIM